MRIKEDMEARVLCQVLYISESIPFSCISHALVCFIILIPWPLTKRKLKLLKDHVAVLECHQASVN